MSSICFNKINGSLISKVLLSCALLIGLGCNAQSTSSPSNSATPTPTTTADASSINSKSTHQGYPNVRFSTTQGDFVVELYPDKAPKTVENFIKLAKAGFYDNTKFHRVIKGFMIQGGDPTGTGYGDPKIPNIKDEFTHKPKNSNERGTIAMANAGPNTGSSQFFINLVDNNFLDTKHPAFGKVIQGMDIVDKLGKTKTGANDKPVKDIKIISATILN